MLSSFFCDGSYKTTNDSSLRFYSGGSALWYYLRVAHWCGLELFTGKFSLPVFDYYWAVYVCDGDGLFRVPLYQAGESGAGLCGDRGVGGFDGGDL